MMIFISRKGTYFEVYYGHVSQGKVLLVPEIVLKLQKNKPTQSHKTKLSKIGF